MTERTPEQQRRYNDLWWRIIRGMATRQQVIEDACALAVRPDIIQTMLTFYGPEPSALPHQPRIIEESTP